MSSAPPSPASESTPNDSVTVFWPEFPGFANSTLEWLTVFLDFLARTAWPLLTLLVLYTVWRPKNRKTVLGAFHAMTTSIGTMKFAGIELEFRNLVGRLGEKLQQSETRQGESEDAQVSDHEPDKVPVGAGPSKPPPSSAGGINWPARTTDSKGWPMESPDWNNLADETRDTASARLFSVLQAHQNVEKELHLALEQTLPFLSSALPDAEMQSLGRALNRRHLPLLWDPALKIHLLTPGEVAALRDVQQARNLIAHQVDAGAVRVGPEAAEEYIRLCEQLIDRIRKRVAQILAANSK